MAQPIDGWTLLARISANPHRFGACDATVALVALLLLRSQLAQGVSNEEALIDLSEIVGEAPMIEVIENLASYEVLRILDNIDGPDALGAERTAQAARRRLIAIVRREGGLLSFAGAPPRYGESISGRPLRRHRAMGARRIRPAS
jgi:hypothetical protein